MAMDRLFHLMQEKSATDMFLSPNAAIHVKIKGRMVPVNQQKMDNATILALLNEVVPGSRMQELERDNELNIGLPIAGVGSFRVSVFKQRGTISAVIRYIPFDIPPFEDLGLPPILTELITRERALPLVVGSTG